MALIADYVGITRPLSRMQITVASPGAWAKQDLNLRPRLHSVEPSPRTCGLQVKLVLDL